MLTSTPEAGEILESSERQFAQRCLIDWADDGLFTHPLSDMSDYLVSTSKDQTLSSTAPEELMLIEGYAAASLDMEVAGTYDGLSLVAHFAPYNGRSIFYTTGLSLGVTIGYEVGVWTVNGWEWFRQFTGIVREVAPDRSTGKVKISCLDNAERLRTSVDIPPYALFRSYLQDGYKRGGLVDSSSIIDLAARSGGFTMGPRNFWAWWQGQERTNKIGPILSVPFHGSILPEIGILDGVQEFHLTEDWEDNQYAYRAEQYTLGPHGYLALNAVPPERADWGVKNYWIDEWDKQAGSAWGTWVQGTWIYWPGDNINGDCIIIDTEIRKNHFELYVRGADGGVEARLREQNGALTWSDTSLRMTSPGWHYIEGNYLVENSANLAIRARVDDTYTAETRVTNRNVNDVNDMLSGLVRVRNEYALSDLYVVKAGVLTTFSNFTYSTLPHESARVSWGRNRLAYTLRESGREGWDTAKELAAAEYGTVFFDEYGRFVFWNYDDINERQSWVNRSYTLDEVSSLSLRNTLDSVRNIWTVTTQTASAFTDIAYDLADDGVPMKRDSRTGELLPSSFIMPPNSGNEYFITVNDHVIQLNPNNINLFYPTEFGPWEEHYPTFSCKSYTFTDFRELGPNSEQKLVTRELARLWLTNGHNEAVGFVLIRDASRPHDGEARFRLEALMVHENPEYSWSIRDEASITEYGERILELERSFWHQDEWQTRAMLSALVSKFGRPTPVTDDITVPGDPRIQLGDVIEVNDLDGVGERTWLQIYGIQRDCSVSEGITDTYRVEVIKPPGEGIWDSATYGLWDQSLIWT